MNPAGVGPLVPAGRNRLPHLHEPGNGDQVDCFQMIANRELNVVELGDGTGTAEPWVILDPIVYYWRNDLVSPPNYYLFIMDTIAGGADELAGDTTPSEDWFAQGILMPDNLVSVQIVYDTATQNSESVDNTYGQFWHVDENGDFPEDGAILYWENPDWDVIDPNNPAEEWLNYTVTITQTNFLSELSGNRVALLFYNITDTLPPDESTLFDNITVTACVPSEPVARQIFLPNIVHVANTTPVCVPPTEVPQDEVDANRGLVQTSARCITTLSQLDVQDYYTFIPQQGGNHTLRLSNLPPGSEWSGSVIVKTGGSYAYAPGPTGGQCRIATPGSGNKQVTCSLQAGREYVVKVSAGQYTGLEANYEMQVVR
jgi:hypothetical protein